MMIPEEVTAAVRTTQAHLVSDGHGDAAQALADTVDAIHRRELDNHRAADMCPYCTPDPAKRQHDLVDVDAAMRELFPERYGEAPTPASVPSSIEDMAPGTTFVWNTDRWDVARRWTVREEGGARYLVDGDGRQWPASMFDPSTVSDVTPPKEADG